MKMTEGFYLFKGNVHYGEYPPEQVNGGSIMKFISPEKIKTDCPYQDDDVAVSFWQNHTLIPPELHDFKSGLDTLSKTFKTFDSEHQKIDFSDIEQKLNITFPAELKYLYSFLLKNPVFMHGKERFLPLGEIYADNGNIVFYKAKRTPVGLSSDNRVLMRYYKNRWHYYESDENFMQFVFQYITANAVFLMPYSSKAILRGNIKSSFSAKETLCQAFEGILKLLQEYRNYNHYILYGDNKSLVWFRSSGMYADMIIGSHNQSTLDAIISSVPADWNAQWKPDWKTKIK